jgi:putative ABC transport system permease protein
MLTRGVALVTARGDTSRHAAQLNGMLFPAGPLQDSLLDAGRSFTAAEGASGALVVVISHQLAADFARGRKPAATVGDTLLFQGEPRVIVGVLKATDADRAQRIRGAVMPVGAMPAAPTGPLAPRLGGGGASLAVTAPSVEAVNAVRSGIERWAARRWGSSWSQRVDIALDQSRVAQLQTALRIFKLFMGSLMSISLIVGGIGIMNVLLSSVVERTREIGIRKASGASQRDILWQFLGESVTITGAGSLVGLLLGAGAAFLISAIMRRVANAPRLHAWVSPSTVLVAVVASVAVGLIFGLYPALRAARLAPIEAIHPE